MKITVPPFSWFWQSGEHPETGNVYSGSVGADAKTGTLLRETFHYRIFVRPADGAKPPFLIAEWYLREPWRSGRDGGEACRAFFECSEKGCEDARRWLESACDVWEKDRGAKREENELETKPGTAKTSEENQ